VCVCVCVYIFHNVAITLKNKFKLFVLSLDENRQIFIIWPC